MRPTAEDRRLHQRRAVCHPVTLEPADGGTIACETVDVSVGGMKVSSTARIPTGPVHVVISAAGDDLLILPGEVVEEIIDASTGDVTARIVFSTVPAPVAERVVALPAHRGGQTRSRRRGVVALAAAIAAGLVIAGAVYAADGGDDDADLPAAAPTAETSRAGRSEPAPLDAPPRVLVSPATTTPPAPLVPADPAPSLRAVPRPAPAPPPAAAPSPEPAPRVDRTDDLTRVVLGETAEETSVQTTTRPSPEGDDVRMQLNVTPEPDGTTLPISVRIENRGGETLTFPDGLRITVTATRDGVDAASVTLASDVRELAPGQSVTVDGLLDFGATGEYDVSATTTIG